MKTNSTNKPPVFIFSAGALPATSIQDFFEDRKYAELIEKPPYLRYGGWNMLNLSQANLNKGQYWEVKNGDRKTIRIYQDGTLVVLGVADYNFLAWGRSAEEFLSNPILHPLAIIEFTYEFVSLYQQIMKHLDKKQSVDFAIQLKNSELPNGNRLKVSTRSIHEMWAYGESKEVNDFSELVHIDLSKPFLPERVAYLLVQRLFAQGNITGEDTPYTKVVDGLRMIDWEKIRDIR